MTVVKSVSVIIPTRNRAGSLKSLLDSLHGSQGLNCEEVEIIVVNNGSTDHTRELLAAEQTSTGSKLIALEERQPGKSNAVNRGLAVARGDIFLIVDDDVSVDPKCVAKHVEAHEQGSFAAIQGKVLPGTDPHGRRADPQRLREYNIPIIDHGSEVVEIRGLTGTNISFKREVVEKIGGFDTRLGPGAAGFSEDTEFSLRMRRAGFNVGYMPQAIVYHELNPDRYGRSYNRDVQYRKGLSRSLYRRDSIYFKVLPDLFANYFRYGVYRAFGMTQKAYKTEGRIMKCRGYLAGKVFHRESVARGHGV